MTDDGRLHTQLPPSPATRASSLTAPKHRLPPLESIASSYPFRR